MNSGKKKDKNKKGEGGIGECCVKKINVHFVYLMLQKKQKKIEWIWWEMQGIWRQECSAWREKLRVMPRKRWSSKTTEKSEIGRVATKVVVVWIIVARIVGNIRRYTINAGGLEIRKLSASHRAEHSEEDKR